jgi:hypothetical protein
MKHQGLRANIAPKLVTAGLPPSFEALSIGTREGQLAIIPLDESDREAAMALVNLWNAFISKQEK